MIGELACGNLRNRSQVLDLLQGLPEATVASDSEVLLLIERERLMGRGIGYVDAHLLAAAWLSHCRLWTQDLRLAAVPWNRGWRHAQLSRDGIHQMILPGVCRAI